LRTFSGVKRTLLSAQVGVRLDPVQHALIAIVIDWRRAA
jgi:hypothetical protein